MAQHSILIWDYYQSTCSFSLLTMFSYANDLLPKLLSFQKIIRWGMCGFKWHGEWRSSTCCSWCSSKILLQGGFGGLIVIRQSLTWPQYTVLCSRCLVVFYLELVVHRIIHLSLIHALLLNICLCWFSPSMGFVGFLSSNWLSLFHKSRFLFFLLSDTETSYCCKWCRVLFH